MKVAHHQHYYYNIGILSFIMLNNLFDVVHFSAHFYLIDNCRFLACIFNQIECIYISMTYVLPVFVNILSFIMD